MVSSFSMSTHATAMKISTCWISAFCYNGEWYNTRFVPAALVEAILNSPRVADVHKEQLQKMIVRKGELSFYDIFTLARAESTS